MSSLTEKALSTTGDSSSSAILERTDGIPPSTHSSNEKNNDELVKTEESQEYITGWKLIAVVASMTLACFLLLLDQTILATAVPVITTKFHSLPDVGWYAGAYQLATATPQPLTGKIYTYFSAKVCQLTRPKSALSELMKCSPPF